MSKIFSKISLGLLAAGALAWSAGAAQPETRTLSGHVPKVVTQLHLNSTGPLAGTNHLHLAIGLPLRNPDGVNVLLEQINNPASPNYHHYLTPDQFASQFGPTEQQYQSVVDFARNNGFTISTRHSNRMLLEVDADAAHVEQAFNVKLQVYKHPKENRSFFAPDQEPSVPASLPILDISGMSDYPRAYPRLVTPSAKARAATPKTGSGIGGLFLGDDFRAAYVPGTTLTGAGQKVALFQADGYLASDIAGYEQLTGRSPVALTNILLQGFNGQPTGFGGQPEVTLDIEMVIAMAPGVSQILVYEGDITHYMPNIILNRIATDDAASVVSCSWGWSGGPSATTDQIFQQMILQGQTFFDASGDVDAFLPPGQPGSVDDPTVPNAPSDDPYITQVGGTTLTTTGPGGARVSEKVWNYGLIDPVNLDGVGSSGGISGFYPIPSWQQGVNMVTNLGSTTFRSLPDVALTADNVDIFLNGAETGEAGTSCAAPLWAGFTALVNQQAAMNGRQQVGFLNPALYALGKSANYASYYNDITTGDNTWSQSPVDFPAVPGFDLCTGWGTPVGTNLINALVGGSQPTNSSGGFTLVNVTISAPVGPWPTNLSVLNGSNPNGDWFLFVQDDKVFDTGMINSGYYVTLTTASYVGAAADNYLVASRTNLVYPIGTNFNFTLTVTNYGPSPATNVLVTDTLPTPLNGVTLVSSNTATGTVSSSGGALFWNVGNLAVSNGAALTLNFATLANGSYVNLPVVSASATTPDANPDDNSAPTVILVGNPSPVLSGNVTAPGGHLQFQVTDPYGNVSVIIQTATNLAQVTTNPAAWMNIYTNTTPFTFTDPNLDTNPLQFYRAITGP